ncbi:MAG: heavy metal translocating P-type ATPase, partial [Moorea sp. SIO4E2]|nr:heavy metal translocating P-type ATPase [Moorena sp. SIO4E2]
MAEHHHHQDCCKSGHCIEAVAEVTTHDDCCGNSQGQEVTTHDHCCGNSQGKEVTTHDDCCGNSQRQEVTTHDDCCGNSQGKNEFNLWRELRAVAIATPLLLIGLIFQDSLHQTPFGIAEYAILIPAYLLCGWGVLTTAGRNILQGRIFDENFLMTIATIGAIAIHELPEAVGVMLFYQVGELVQGSAVGRSRRSIRALLEVRPDTANLLVNGEIKTVSPDQVAVGEMIRVRPGEKVPLDGEIIKGSSQLDTSALTGESLPRTVVTGDLVLAGMIN